MSKLKQEYKPQEYSNIAIGQLETLKNIESLTNDQIKTFQSLNDFSAGINGMTFSMAKFANIAKTLEETLNPKVLGEVISSSLMREMKPILTTIQNVAENVDKNSEKLTNFRRRFKK